jgi:oligogalacturonide transport system substrate-binding protein
MNEEAGIMKKPTKFIGILLSMVLFLAVVAGCSNGSTPVTGGEAGGQTGSQAGQPQKEQPQEPPKKVTLRFAWFGTEDRHKAVLEAVDLYMKKNPNITIEPEYGGFDGYYQKLVTQFAGGTAPDITHLGITWIDDIAVKGKLVLDLNTQKKNLNLEAFNQEFLNKYTVFGGQLIGLPMGVNGMVIAYNPEFFKKFNIPTDTNWDWVKIHELGKKVHQQDPKAYLLAQLDVRTFLHPFVKQQTNQQWIKDDKMLGFDQAILTEAFTYYKKLLDDGVLQPLAESSLYPDISQNVSWQKGNAGMVFVLASTLSKHKTFIPQLDVTTFPIAANAKTSAVQVNPTTPLVINKATKNPEEAAKFISWLLTDPEAATRLRDVFSVPPVEKNAKKLAEEKVIDATVVKAVGIALAKPGDPENGISGNQELFKLSEDYLQQVGFGKISPEQGASELIRRMTDKLKDIK